MIKLVLHCTVIEHTRLLIYINAEDTVPAAHCTCIYMTHRKMRHNDVTDFDEIHILYHALISGAVSNFSE